jgi:apolipoprotein N-acyltransferase
VAALAAAVTGRRPAVGGALGALCGVAFFAPLLSWTNLHTGVGPWLLLAGTEAVFFALLGAVSAWCSTLVVRQRLLLAPLTGALWTAQEAVRDRAPFGGFPWGRLAFSQGDSPLLRLAGFGGAPLVTFGVATVGGLLAAAWLAAWFGGWRGSAARLAAGWVAVGVVAVTGLVFLPSPSAGGRPVTVAIVQGNVPRMGLDFNAQRRAVLDNHAAATRALAQRVAAGLVRQPDLVVWPENASDIDPLKNPDAARVIDDAVAAVGAPVLVGAVLDAGPVARNAGLVWQPGGGPGQRYFKRHPVPFTEYVPMRRVARMVTTKVDMVRVDFAPGDGPGVLTMGPARVGDVICYEVAYDSLVRDVVVGGAGLIAVQTNNATFNAAEAAQQLAMVRLRAVEHGRPALMASTVGISAFVGVDGRVVQSTRFNTGAVLVDELRLGSVRTVATRLGAGPEYVIVAGVLGCLLMLVVQAGLARRAVTVAARGR